MLEQNSGFVDGTFTLNVIEDTSKITEEEVSDHNDASVKSDSPEEDSPFSAAIKRKQEQQQLESLIKSTKDALENDSLDKPYKCPSCVYETPRKSLMLTHLEAHLTNQRQYKCNFCEFSSFYKHVWSIHRARCSTGHRKVVCPHCDYVTAKHRSLKKHIDVKHLKVKKVGFRCRECRVRFEDKQEFEAHKVEFHPKPKKYTCEECEFDTNSKLELQRHRKGHKTAVKREILYKCDLCGLESKHKSNIVRHRSVHL